MAGPLDFPENHLFTIPRHLRVEALWKLINPIRENARLNPPGEGSRPNRRSGCVAVGLCVSFSVKLPQLVDLLSTSLFSYQPSLRNIKAGGGRESFHLRFKFVTSLQRAHSSVQNLKHASFFCRPPSYRIIVRSPFSCPRILISKPPPNMDATGGVPRQLRWLGCRCSACQPRNKGAGTWNLSGALCSGGLASCYGVAVHILGTHYHMPLRLLPRSRS